jgi:thiol-disulfide isomerase/thioredoxin
MINKSRYFFSLLFLIFFSKAQASSIKAGPWRFELQLTHATVPFIIHFSYDSHSRLKGVLSNGEEKILLDNISIQNKEIHIPLQTYESSLILAPIDQKSITGHLVKKNKNPIQKFPIQGVFGPTSRYPTPIRKSQIDLNGKWGLLLKDQEGKEFPGVGIFKQQNNHFQASILTPTGDYRYIEGVIEGERFEGASFDGVYNYLLKGSIKNNQLQAQILSSSITQVTGSKNPKAQLPNAYEQTKIKSLNFKFPNLKGELVSLTDSKFKGKPVIVQIYGSWCPNCMDEMNFLIPWYEKNLHRGIEIVALAFERSQSEAQARIQLLKVQNKYKVPYPILLAGSTSEDKPADKINGLQNFISFPTTLFLDRAHKVIKVHAGFNGPSTGEYYTQWIKEFNSNVDELLE